ncbi:MAG: hypothetical protein KBC39_01390 [Thermotogae bacterium]|nr:hypothetical protein [Thermotogota bacterium]
MDNLIQYLGTPRIFTEVLNYLFQHQDGSGLILTKTESGSWVVQDSRGYVPHQYLYASSEEIQRETADYLAYPMGTDTLLFSSIPVEGPALQTVVKVLEIQELYRTSEKQSETISKLVYSITGIETILNTILEPVEREEMIGALNDAMGELLLSFTVLYRRGDNGYERLRTHGLSVPPAQLKFSHANANPLDFSFPVDLKKNPLFPEWNQLSDFRGLYGIPIIMEEVVQYVIIAGKNEAYGESDQSILEGLTRVISKIIEYYMLKEEVELKEKAVEKSNFQLLSFFKGFQYLSAQESVSDKINVIQDMYHELFQPSVVLPYYKKNWSQILWPFPENDQYPALYVKFVSCWDVYHLDKKTEREAFIDDFGNAEDLLAVLEKERRYPTLATILRSGDGDVLSLLLFEHFPSGDYEFLKMLNVLSGLSLHDYFNRSEIKKLENTYENVMKTFQKVNELYVEVRKTIGLSDFYETAGNFLANQFQISGFYLLFSNEDKRILLPEETEPLIQEKLLQHFNDKTEEIWIDYLPEKDAVLYTVPVSFKEKRLFIALESRDESKTDFLIQLLRLGFKDLLARIIFD